jgi:hypothetical protein
MKKLKIRLIDGNTKRGEDICRAIASFNILQPHEACLRSIRSDTGSWDDRASTPDLFILHLNDHRFQGEPYYKYLQSINSNLPDALIVLYSGGNIHVSMHTTHHLTLRQDDNTWDFGVANGEQFCIIKHSIYSASDLRIAQALQKYSSNSSKEEFFQALQSSEESRDYMAGLAILCQGYFIVHAEYRGVDKDWKDEEIASILEQIGWTSLMDSNGSSASSVRTNLGSELDRVRTAKWWLDVFGNSSTLSEGLEKEFGTIPNEVTNLLDLLSKDGEIKPPNVVAAAYRAITRRLKRE